MLCGCGRRPLGAIYDEWSAGQRDRQRCPRHRLHQPGTVGNGAARHDVLRRPRGEQDDAIQIRLITASQFGVFAAAARAAVRADQQEFPAVESHIGKPVSEKRVHHLADLLLSGQSASYCSAVRRFFRLKQIIERSLLLLGCPDGGGWNRRRYPGGETGMDRIHLKRDSAGDRGSI